MSASYPRTENDAFTEGKEDSTKLASDQSDLLTNIVPDRLARAIQSVKYNPSGLIGKSSSEDVYVTDAKDIEAVQTPKELEERLTLVNQDGQLLGKTDYTIIEFDTPIGVTTPVEREDHGFVQGGKTAGGAKEFVIPNQPIKDLDNLTTRRVKDD